MAQAVVSERLSLRLIARNLFAFGRIVVFMRSDAKWTAVDPLPPFPKMKIVFPSSRAVLRTSATFVICGPNFLRL